MMVFAQGKTLGRTAIISWLPLGLHFLSLGYWAGIAQLWGHSAFATSVLSFVLLLSFHIFRSNPKMEALGVVHLPLGILLILLSMLMPDSQVVTGDSSWWTLTHVSLILIGLACFAISFGHSLLFLFVRHRLKSKNLKGIGGFPSIERLDRNTHIATIIGFVSLVAGVASGLLWSMETGLWRWDLGSVGAICLCVFYAASIHARIIFGRRMHWTAWFSVGGFILIFVVLGIVGYLGGWHMGDV